MEPVVRTEGLTKIYKTPLEGPGVLALDDLTLEVEPGQVFAMVGPNGSGKTTTLKLLMGLIFPTSGRAWLFGKNPRDVNVKHRIGFLPDGPYFYGHLNGYELLEFYAGLFRLPAAVRQERIPQLIDLVGMTGSARQRIYTYSKGMVQRIGLAQALLNDPELIFLDEPTSGVDPIGSRDIRDLILHLRNQGKTIFLCSHFLAEIEAIIDRVAILDRGRLLRVGKIEDLLIKRDVLEVRARGVNPAGREKLQRVGTLTAEDESIKVEVPDGPAVYETVNIIRDHEGHLDSVSPKRMSLEELFIECVRGPEQGPAPAPRESTEEGEENQS